MNRVTGFQAMSRTQLFRADREKYYKITFGSTRPPLTKRMLLWLFNPAFHCVMAYRFGGWSSRLYRRNKLLGLPFKLAYVPLGMWMKALYQMNMEDATFGPGLYIGHIGTIYIGPTVIGANCSLTHNVTIGIGQSEGSIGLPSIGDNVWIGTGATISGAITIGNGVTVANGSILSRSVPDGCLVAGNPGRVVLRDYDNSRLFGSLRQQTGDNLRRGDGSVFNGAGTDKAVDGVESTL